MYLNAIGPMARCLAHESSSKPIVSPIRSKFFNLTLPTCPCTICQSANLLHA
jgi:hypothetical protein